MAIQEIRLGIVANNGEGDPLREGGDKINQNFTDPSNAASYEVGTEAGQIPRNSELGTAAQANTGTAAGEVPTNGDLGTASTKNTGTATGQIPTADQLNMVGETNYTTGNLNLYEFGGVAAGDDIVIGYANSSTSARFYAPIISNTAPTGITVTGTFDARIMTSYAAVGSGLVPTGILSSSSNRMVSFQVSGLSGLSLGDPVMLRTESSSSKIVVNF